MCLLVCSHDQLSLVRGHFRAHTAVVGRIQFLTGCWLEAALCSLPHDLSIRVNTGEGTQQGEEYQQDEKMKVMVSCNLIMEGTFHHFRCILFVRNKLLDPAHNGRGLH